MIEVGNALAATVNNTTLTLSGTVDLTLPGIFPLPDITTTVNVGTDGDGDGTADAIPVPIGAFDGTLLTDDDYPLAVTGNVAGLGFDLELIEETVGDALSTTLQGVVNPLLTTTIPGLTSTLTDLVDDLLIVLEQVLDPLAGVLSLGVNVQPDAPNPPPGQPTPMYCMPDYDLATSTSTAEYMVTALRVSLLSGVVGTPGDVDYCSSIDTQVNLATASAGPVTIPPPAP